MCWGGCTETWSRGRSRRAPVPLRQTACSWVPGPWRGSTAHIPPNWPGRWLSWRCWAPDRGRSRSPGRARSAVAPRWYRWQTRSRGPPASHSNRRAAQRWPRGFPRWRLQSGPRVARSVSRRWCGWECRAQTGRCPAACPGRGLWVG